MIEKVINFGFEIITKRSKNVACVSVVQKHFDRFNVKKGLDFFRGRTLIFHQQNESCIRFDFAYNSNDHRILGSTGYHNWIIR